MDAVGQKLLDVAKTQLGYTEKSDGYTKYGDWFAKNVDEQHDSYFVTAPWCDMFLAWAADKAGVKDSVGQFASTRDHAAWFEQQGAWGTKPKPGALVFYSWSGSKSISDVDHVGLVERVEGGTLHTIEGNTEGVHLMRQTRDTDSVVGYGYPAKVKVAGQAAGGAAPGQQYVPRHAAPAPSVETILKDAPPAGRTTTQATSGGHHGDGPLSGHEVALSGLAAVLLCGSLALAVGRTTAAKVPAPPQVRVRKRGRHHRTAPPVALPAEITAADLDAAEAGTVVMPALTLAAAAEAEDRAFWGKIAQFEDDQELAFWSDLHAAVGRPAAPLVTPAAASARPAAPDRTYSADGSYAPAGPYAANGQYAPDVPSAAGGWFADRGPSAAAGSYSAEGSYGAGRSHVLDGPYSPGGPYGAERACTPAPGRSYHADDSYVADRPYAFDDAFVADRPYGTDRSAALDASYAR